jgi:hypothetical protein
VLADSSGLTERACKEAIQRTLKSGSEARHPVTDRPLFAFRLHQFLSKGDTVHVTLEDKETRHLTRDYQRVQPGSGGKLLLPLAFCRECGQEYLTVWRTVKDGNVSYEPRRDTSATGGRAGDGYLYVDPEQPWPNTTEDAINGRRLPDSWLETDEHGEESVRESYRRRLPVAVSVDPYGNEVPGALASVFIPAPFLFCLHCSVSYEQTRSRDFAKLATLDQEGRSSATSLVSASIVRSLKAVPAEALSKKARKLLTFVDNRQDASLQAGHFNDFVQITQLRGALHRAVVAAVTPVSGTRSSRRGLRVHSDLLRLTTRGPTTLLRRCSETPPRPGQTTCSSPVTRTSGSTTPGYHFVRLAFRLPAGVAGCGSTTEVPLKSLPGRLESWMTPLSKS